MIRVLPVPVDIWNQLYDLLKEHSPVFHNVDSQDDPMLTEREERALKQAEATGESVWEFSARSCCKLTQYFFIARDEKELKSRITTAKITAI
jgi:hypothetical protein